MARLQAETDSEGLYEHPNQYEIVIFSEKALLGTFGALAKSSFWPRMAYMQLLQEQKTVARKRSGAKSVLKNGINLIDWERGEIPIKNLQLE